MTDYFDSVVGLDVSRGMIDYARPRIPKATFALTDGISIPLAAESMTAAFSCHVLQHLESADEAMPIFSEIYRVLVPASTMMIHLPMYTFPFARRPLEMVYRLRGWAARRRSSLRRSRGGKGMRVTWYETGWLYRVLGQIGFVDIEFVSFATSVEDLIHPCILARKPAQS